MVYNEQMPHTDWISSNDDDGVKLYSYTSSTSYGKVQVQTKPTSGWSGRSVCKVVYTLFFVGGPAKMSRKSTTSPQPDTAAKQTEKETPSSDKKPF